MGKETECNFLFEVIAPNGLESITKEIATSGLNLYIYKSGYNGKFILRSNDPGIIDLDMDSSDTEIMFGSGEIHLNFEESIKIIEKISTIFRIYSYPHKIGVDNESGEKTFNLQYKWNNR